MFDVFHDVSSLCPNSSQLFGLTNYGKYLHYEANIGAEYTIFPLFTQNFHRIVRKLTVPTCSNG